MLHGAVKVPSSPVPLYDSVTPANGSFSQLAYKNTELSPKAMIDVIKANFIVFLHVILNFETRTPPKTWPRAAPGIKIAPPRVAAKLDDNPNWFSINLGKNVANPVVTKASEEVDRTKHIKTVFLIKFFRAAGKSLKLFPKFSSDVCSEVLLL